jgi:hypothetical protein
MTELLGQTDITSFHSLGPLISEVFPVFGQTYSYLASSEKQSASGQQNWWRLPHSAHFKSASTAISHAGMAFSN